MSMWKEFQAFLIKANVLALAIAVVVGGALNALATPDPAGWQTAVVPGPLPFKIGHFGGALLNFLIVGFVAWRLSKIFIRPEPPSTVPATKNCAFCKMSIDAMATRCAHCTSQL